MRRTSPRASKRMESKRIEELFFSGNLKFLSKIIRVLKMGVRTDNKR
jgi:hypothetical protein